MIPPDVIEQAVIDLLDTRLVRHIALLERSLGLNARTIVLPNIGLLEGDETRFALTDLDAVFVGIDGTAETPERHADTDGQHLQAVWRLNVEVITLGGGQNPWADGKQRARWIGMAVMSCLAEEFAARDERVAQVDVTGVQFGTAGNDDAALGRCELELNVTVPATVRLLPIVGSRESDDPYDPPIDWQPVTAATVDVYRDPITEP